MKNWKVLNVNNKIASEEAIVDELLTIRDIKKKEFREFFDPSVSDLKLNKSGISKIEIAKAKKRIDKAIKDKETVVIFGDYDVDGICAAAILWETIYKKNKNTFPYLPDRFSEGYGLSKNGIDGLLRKYPDTRLIITVDNGIVANEAVEYARKKGLDIIITDHHVSFEKLPKALALVHTVSLCGAGIAWMLARELGFESESGINEKLELACLATVADLVPLTDLNRVIVKIGLKYLRNTKRIGLIELYKLASINPKEIDAYHIGYIIGPRINASGRINHAIDSLRLICSSDIDFVKKVAHILENTNRKRQQMVKKAYEHAKLSVIAEKKIGKILIVHSDSYSEGIVGLIASRLVGEYDRPVLAISTHKETSKGSARSINSVNIVELIRKFSSYLENVGGHPMAAGFSIKTTNIEIFKEEIIKEAEVLISAENLKGEIIIDMDISFELISIDLFKKLEELGPFGIGNYKPVFVSRDILVKNVRRLGKDGDHLKLTLESNNKQIDAIGFGMGDKFEINIGSRIDAVFSIEENVWNGKSNLQLKLKDIREVKNLN